MNFWFNDATELEVDIITEILDKNEVKYKVFHSDMNYGHFTRSLYHVVIDVELEYFDYLKELVKKRIDDIVSLESDYNLKSFKHPPLVGQKRRGRKRKGEECKFTITVNANPFSEIIPDGVYTQAEFFKKLDKWRNSNG